MTPQLGNIHVMFVGVFCKEGYCEQLNTTMLENVEEMGQFLVVQSQEKVENLVSNVLVRKFKESLKIVLN